MAVGDAEAVALLAGELGYPSTAARVARRIEWIAGRSGEHLLVAEHDGTVVGWTHVRAIASIELEPHAEIWGLVVSESVRSRGIGRALIAECERWALAQGFPTVRLRSNVVRTRAHALYERLGYGIVKQQKVFEKTLRG